MADEATTRAALENAMPPPRQAANTNWYIAFEMPPLDEEVRGRLESEVDRLAGLSQRTPFEEDIVREADSFGAFFGRDPFDDFWGR